MRSARVLCGIAALACLFLAPRLVDRLKAEVQFVCHDDLWELDEWCGHDAFATTGYTEMNHDCVVDMLDFSLFAQDYGDFGADLSGDFNGDGVVNLSDFATFATTFTHVVSPCQWGGMQPDSCAGMIALSFSSDSTNIVSTTAQSTGPGRVYLVIDGWSGAGAIEYTIETSPNILITNPAVPGYPYFNSGGFGHCDPDPQHHTRLFVTQFTPWPDGPINWTYLDYLLLDTDPAWMVIRGSDDCYIGQRIRWGTMTSDQSIDFEFVSNVGINGPAPSGESTCANGGCDVIPASIDFGPVSVGAFMDTVFTITNLGSTVLEGTVSESCPEYSLLSGGGFYSLLPGEFLDVTVRYAPTGCQTDLCTIDTGAGCADVLLTGEGTEPPLCLVAPGSFDFGAVWVGSHRDTTFVIKNEGCGVLSGNVDESCAHYEILGGGGPYSLSSGDSVIVTLRFAPTSSGIHLCSVETGDAACTDVSCAGWGEELPLCAVWPDTVDFGTVPLGLLKELGFVVKNDGGGVLSGNVTEACGAYDVSGGGGPFALAAGESLLVTVQFAPTTEGLQTCTIDLGETLCTNVFVTGVGGTAPFITGIIDVGNDQGRFVDISFNASSRDRSGSMTPVVQYEAYRRIDTLPSKAGTAPLEPLADRIRNAREAGMLSDPGILAAWHFAGAIPAHGDPDYRMVAPTLTDSTVEHGMHWSVFFVRAATEEPLVFFDSVPDSGYSLDNLAPHVPQGLQLTTVSGTDVQLEWLSHGDDDFSFFSLYRGTSPDFPADAQSRLARLTTTNYLDAGAASMTYHYKLSATDYAGNESACALVSMGPTGTGEGGLPSVFAFEQVSSNPVRENAVYLYELPTSAPVTITAYDVRGRVVLSALDGREIPAGRYRWEWSLKNARGDRVSPGVYYQRFDTGSASFTVKTVVLH